MANTDFSCAHCEHYRVNGSPGTWDCARFHKHIERHDPDWCVCRTWRPSQHSFTDEVRQYFANVAPGSLNHLRSRELYRTAPECELMPLS